MATTASTPAPGDRIRVTGVLPDDPAPIPIGNEGTVTGVRNVGTAHAQIDVEWDDGRTLMLLPDDPFEII